MKAYFFLALSFSIKQIVIENVVVVADLDVIYRQMHATYSSLSADKIRSEKPVVKIFFIIIFSKNLLLIQPRSISITIAGHLQGNRPAGH